MSCEFGWGVGFTMEFEFMSVFALNVCVLRNTKGDEEVISVLP